ncbi:hypothetical protein BJP34_19590 [Moorena producens PAL-8-15-08-1]|uniref:DUF4231 domain-containing protein n=1 Tax=Moorena producens PAL-8-15-08-1 TaxID=1458985 RepID=A0A1D8TUP2_9CYAN|nr:DUF4231 domain-containing protein [Moorena producens]AOX01347.1 hypothetical protein BJP34_19590 [Moorena producens PAL-8-15-08-1]
MTNLQATQIDGITESKIPNTIDQVSSSSITKKPSVLLKTGSYLFLVAGLGIGIASIFISDRQLLLIVSAACLALFIFLFLINQQLWEDYKEANYQSKLIQKSKLCSVLWCGNNSTENNTITLAIEKALSYSQELIDDYKKTRKNSRNAYYLAQMLTIILSGITPILVLVDKLETGSALLKWLPVIFPAIASIVASVSTSFPFQENWIAANTTVELLEAEQEKFILGVTKAYRFSDSSDKTDKASDSSDKTDKSGKRQKQLQNAIEYYIVQVNKIHLKQVQSSDGNESGSNGNQSGENKQD